MENITTLYVESIYNDLCLFKIQNKLGEQRCN